MECELFSTKLLLKKVENFKNFKGKKSIATACIIRFSAYCLTTSATYLWTKDPGVIFHST